jgi:hypothetical protein
MMICEVGERKSRVVYRRYRSWCTNALFGFIVVTSRSAVHSFTGITITSRCGRCPNNEIEGIRYKKHHQNVFFSSNEDQSEGDQSDNETPVDEAVGSQQLRMSRVRSRVKDLARRMVSVPIHVASTITPMPQAVAAVLKDATLNAVDLAVEEGLFF